MTNKQRRIAQKSFPAKKRNEHTFTPADLAALPNTGVEIAPPLVRFEHKGKVYVIRTEGKADSFGLGKVVSPGGAVSFEPGAYNLSRKALVAYAENVLV